MRNNLNIGDRVKVALPNPKVIGNGEIGAVTNIDLMNDEIYYMIKLDNGFESPIKNPDVCLGINSIQVKEGEYEVIETTNDSIPDAPKPLGTSNLTFGGAFEQAKKGRGFRLPQWQPDVVIRAQYPDANSKMTAPYLYVESRFGKVPWKETMIELFAENWQTVD